MAAWTKENWNTIIVSINTLIANGCTGVDPLDGVTDGHVWSIDDVSIVQTALTELCGTEFTVEPTAWSQAMIDEINAAIEDCNCSQGCPDSTTREIYCGTWQPVVLQISDQCDEWNSEKATLQTAVDNAVSAFQTAVTNTVDTVITIAGQSAGVAFATTLFGITCFGDSFFGDMFFGDTISDPFRNLLTDVIDALFGAAAAVVYYVGCEAWDYCKMTYGNDPFYSLSNAITNTCRQGGDPVACSAIKGEYATAQAAYYLCGTNNGANFLQTPGGLQGVAASDAPSYNQTASFTQSFSDLTTAAENYSTALTNQADGDATIAQQIADWQNNGATVENLVPNAFVESSVADAIAMSVAGKCATYRTLLLAYFKAKSKVDQLTSENADANDIDDAAIDMNTAQSAAQAGLADIDTTYSQWQTAVANLSFGVPVINLAALLTGYPQAWSNRYSYDQFKKGRLNCQPTGQFNLGSSCEWTPDGLGFCWPAVIGAPYSTNCDAYIALPTHADSPIDVTLTIARAL